MIRLPTSILMAVLREDVRNWVTPAWHVNDVIQMMRRTDVTPAMTTVQQMDAAVVVAVVSSLIGRSMNERRDASPGHSIYVNVNVNVNGVIQTMRRTDAIPVMTTVVGVVVVVPSMVQLIMNSRRDTSFGQSMRQTRVRVLTNSVDATVMTSLVNWEHWHSQKYYYSNEWTHSKDYWFPLLVSLQT